MNEIKLALPFSDYRSSHGYGSSSLRAMRNGPPALVQWQIAHPESTEATRVGAAAHCLILTPFLFEKTYAMKPEGMSFSTKDGKAWREAQGDLEILTFEETKAVLGIRKAFYEKSYAFEALRKSTAIEASVFWDCEASGLRSKGRPDFYDSCHVYELKISRYANRQESIAFRAYTEGWMHQLAHNRAGLNACGINVDGARIIVISPKEPHGIFVHLLEVKIDALDLLEMENQNTRKEIAQCDKLGIWPGTSDVWELVEPPSGAFIETAKILEQVEVSQ